MELLEVLVSVPIWGLFNSTYDNTDINRQKCRGQFPSPSGDYLIQHV